MVKKQYEPPGSLPEMTTGDVFWPGHIYASNGHAGSHDYQQALVAKNDAPDARVLIVEDNTEIRFMMSLVLEETCEVDAVGGFEDALHSVRSEDYDVIFIDIDLGEHRTGVDLVKRILDGRLNHGTSLVACTAYAMPGDREKFLQEGFDYYIGKPFTEKDLLNTLEDARSSSPR